MAFEYYFPFTLMIFGVSWQLLSYRNLNFLYGFIVVYIIFLSGMRDRIGPDWPGYEVVFYTFKNSDASIEFVQKAYGMELGYVLINKIIASLGLELWFLYLFIATVSIYLKAKVIKEFSKYTFLGLAFYYIQFFYFEEIIHIRQGISMGFVMISFKYIVERKKINFLICVLLAMGFHISSIIFLIAYWLYKIKIPKVLMIVLLIISLVLSQVNFIEYISPILKLTSGTSYSIMKGLSYLSEEGGINAYEISYSDFVRLIFIFSLVLFKDYLSDKDEMFNGLINYIFLASFFFFAFKSEPIYSTRLTAHFMIFSCIVFPRLLNFIRPYKSYFLLAFWFQILFLILFSYRFNSIHKDSLMEYNNIIYNPSELHKEIYQ